MSGRVNSPIGNRLAGLEDSRWHTGLMHPNPVHLHQAELSEPIINPGNRFHHEALLYTGEEGFLNGTLPFVTEALAIDEPVLVAVAPDRIKLLQEALGAQAEQAHFIDMRKLGGNPARIIPAWREFLDEHSHNGRPVRGIGEPIWPGRSAAELTECQRHESLLNLAFDGGQAWRLLCPYDLDGLDDQVIEAALQSHPIVTGHGNSSRSSAYPSSDPALDTFLGALSPASAGAHELVFTREDLKILRQFISRAAHAASMEDRRTEDLVLAVNEIATNSVRYGGGGTVRIWREADALLCEVLDSGHIDDPLVGRVRPTVAQQTGRGLWMVNNLCDLVQIRSSPAGSVVRVHMRLA
jgi:anti-sigma regulatory factor (Ser/Thr protein kinase)